MTFLFHNIIDFIQREMNRALDFISLLRYIVRIYNN